MTSTPNVAEIDIFFAAWRLLANNCSVDPSIADAMDLLRMAVTAVPCNEGVVGTAKSQLSQLVAASSNVAESVQQQIVILLAAPPVLQQSLSCERPLPLYKQKSCYVQQQMHRILDGIFLGSYHPAADRMLMKEKGITHVCCCINVTPRFPSDFHYLTLAADDSPDFDMSQFFESSFDFIDGCAVGGGSVLVHCGAGISRAPTVVAAYLIRKLHITAKNAVAMIKGIRSCASPNRGFLAQLVAMEQMYCKPT